MKLMFTGIAVALATLFTSTAARAECTTNPGQMGWDAAQNACEDILNGYVPDPWGRYETGEHGQLVFVPERICSIEQVAICKNAMSQYTRQHPVCGTRIKFRSDVFSPSGEFLGTADQIWRTYVFTTCNL